MRAHLVYPAHADCHVAPWTIGNHLLAALVEAGHTVSWSDWDDCRAPSHCDLLIGHPHPEPHRAYELAATCADRKVAICPFTPDHIPWLQGLLDRGAWDHLLAICGPEWVGGLDPTWPATQLDMAVDPVYWEPVERFDTATNRVLYVGCHMQVKGTDRLARLSDVAGDRLDICHVGPGQIGGRVRSLGIAPNGGWRMVAPFFPRIISLGRFDANPTTILEGVAMGMTAFATRGAGWGEDLVTRLPDCDTPAECEEAVRILLEAPLQQRIGTAQSYSWPRFCATVMAAVEQVMAT